MMDFAFTAEQEDIRTLAARLFGGLVDRDLLVMWRELGASGLLGMLVPAGMGGAGLGVVEAAIAAIEAGRVALPAPFRVHLLATVVLEDQGWLSHAMLGNVVLTLVEDPEWVEWGHIADAIVLADGRLVTAPSARARTVRPVMDDGAPVTALALESVPLLPGSLAATAAVLTAAEMLGAARACLDLAVAHARVRRQFGQPIGSFQAVRHMCADMLVDIENLERLIFAAAWAIDADTAEATVWAAATKSEANVLARRVWTNALQVHGGIGFTWEYPLHRVAKRAEALASRFGTTSVLREQLTDSWLQQTGSKGHFE